MIDLRSDTVTMPSREMLETALWARLGDDGRRRADRTGGDPTVDRLEQLAADLTGKEDALFFPTGTMANTAALSSACGPGDRVLIDPLLHMYASEKVAFHPQFLRLEPVFYRLDGDHMPDVADIRDKLEQTGAKMVCVENTHNFSGGSCTTPQRLAEVAEAAHQRGALVHMDGARLFNAATALGVEARELCRPVDTVMFCLSKGLGAPAGSLLCGGAERIAACREQRKLLGGGMRQSGVLAAPGIHALEHNRQRLAEDHDNARAFAQAVAAAVKSVRVVEPRTNIVLLDLAESGIDGKVFSARLEERGVLAHLVPGHVRLTFHLGISREVAMEAARAVIETAEGGAHGTGGV